MSDLPADFSGAKCLFFGLGRSNTAVCKFLLSEGAEIYLTDGKMTDDELVKQAEKAGISKYKIYDNGTKPDFLFRTPGVRPDDPKIVSVIKKRAVLTSETELFFDRIKCRTFGVTGSDGKTTTVTLTGKMLENKPENKDLKVFVGGNIGTPLISLLQKARKDDIVVCELSSFQLMTMKKGPQISAVTNITKNHLDYHRSMDEYIAAKLRIFQNNNCKKLVIKSETDDFLGKKSDFCGEKILFSAYSGNSGLFLRDGYVYRDGEKLFDFSKMLIKGKHNVENFMAAAAMSDASNETVGKVAKSFTGVPHRMEFVIEKKGISFFNSSIDSTPSRSIATLSCFDKPLVLICGGYDKKLDYSEFFKFAKQKADVIITTGHTGKIFYDNFKKIGADVYFEKEFENAVYSAYSHCPENGSVILSPACASFDNFLNFEERGEVFRDLVRSL